MRKAFFIMLWVGVLIIFCAIATLAQEYIVIPNRAFNGRTGTETFKKDSDSGYAYLYTTNTDNQVLYAPVYFPPSASEKKVKNMSIRVSDFNTSGGIVVNLVKLDHTKGKAINIYSIDTGSSEVPGLTTVSNRTTFFITFLIISRFSCSCIPNIRRILSLCAPLQVWKSPKEAYIGLPAGVIPKPRSG